MSVYRREGQEDNVMTTRGLEILPLGFTRKAKTQIWELQESLGIWGSGSLQRGVVTWARRTEAGGVRRRRAAIWLRSNIVVNCTEPPQGRLVFQHIAVVTVMTHISPDGSDISSRGGKLEMIANVRTMTYLLSLSLCFCLQSG